MPINSEISNVNIPQGTQFSEKDSLPSVDHLTLKEAYEYNQGTYKQTQTNVNIPQGTQYSEKDLTPSGDDLTSKEAYEYNQKTYKQTQEEQFKNKKQNRKLRKDFAYKAYDIACGCLSFWIVIVCLSAIVSFVTGRVFLSDTALGIVTTGVTVNVFAALLTVIKGLFSKEGD